jgi:rhodanese-related sulfurtransferase
MKNSLSALDFFSAKLAYEITPEDLAAAQTNGASPVVVDARTEGAWRRGRIPGALHISCQDVSDGDPDLLPDEDADIVVYCWGADDHGAARAAITLIRLGYTQVRELSGGFSSWEDGGFDIEVEPNQARHMVTPIGAPRAG